jgi:uncharacterized protein (DUF2141 family)
MHEKRFAMAPWARRAWRYFLAVMVVLAGAAVPIMSAQAQDQGTIRIKVVNTRGNRGRVHCSLFNEKGDYPNKGALRDLSVPIENGKGVCDFTGFAPGAYAAVVFQDEDANGKFKTNWLGMPQEGYGFSNNLRPRFSAPKFQPASFQYQGGTLEMTIKLLYGP